MKDDSGDAQPHDEGRMNAIRTYNVEAGLPTLDEARRLVIGEIKRAKREALCVGLRKSFGLRKKEAVIKDFIAGEEFSIFNDTVLALLEAVPESLAGISGMKPSLMRCAVVMIRL